MTPSWKEAIAKKYSGILERLNIFERVGFEKNISFLQMNWRIFWVCMMANSVSFEAIETYLH